LAAERGIKLTDASPAQLDELWEDVKASRRETLHRAGERDGLPDM
jgi:hypothetical protein